MLKNLFKLDLRSLAFARVLLGILAFFDIGRRIKAIDVFFSDAGLLTRAELIEHFELNWRMSLLNLNGSYEFALGLAILGMLAAFTFTIGWRTRTSNLIVWLVIISFQTRFPDAASSGGDNLIRVFFFWSLFLPMGTVYSLDRAVSEKKITDYEYFSVFTLTWILQVFVLYFFTFIYKWAPVYHTDFNAVWYMMQLGIFTTSFGQWLGEHYTLTRVLSFASYALEIIGPVMLLIPWKRDIFRGVAVFSFWCFHLGIGLTMHLGNFVPICLIIWVGLIPSSWWNYLAFKLKSETDKMMTLIHDPDSPFARQLGLITKEMFFLDNVRVVPANEKPEGMYSLIDQDSRPVPAPLILSTMLMSSKIFLIRLTGKLLSSDLNMHFGEVNEAGALNPAKTQISHAKSLALLKNAFELVGFGQVRLGINKFEKMMGAFLLALVIGWNIEGYFEERNWHIGSPFDEIMFTLQLNQGWAMFAPHPQRSDGWWVMDGELKNGQKWDALNNKEVNFERPESIFATYESDDWRKFLDNLQGERDEIYLQALGKFLCRRWNTEHRGEKSLQKFRLHFMQEWTNGPKEPPAEVKKLTLWNHSCF